VIREDPDGVAERAAASQWYLSDIPVLVTVAAFEPHRAGRHVVQLLMIVDPPVHRLDRNILG
jgi:hypothetical protein